MGFFDTRVVARCEDFQGNIYRVRTTVSGIFKTEERIKRGIEEEFYRRKRIRLRKVDLLSRT